jgi:hypothetical protein
LTSATILYDFRFGGDHENVNVNFELLALFYRDFGAGSNGRSLDKSLYDMPQRTGPTYRLGYSGRPGGRRCVVWRQAFEAQALIKMPATAAAAI